MFSIVQCVGSLAKVSKIQIDATVFRLHYIFTVLVLILFSVIVTTKQYVGSPIECITTPVIPQEIINSYCWIHATFTIPSAYNKKVGKEVPFPGIDGTNDEKKFRYHMYYQWVFFVLLFQAVAFYLPRWLWLVLEGDRIKTLTIDFYSGAPVEEGWKPQERVLLSYLLCSWKRNDTYALKYIFCEFLNLLNVTGQLFVLNVFFHGEFLRFGLDVVWYANTPIEHRVDPMVALFPRVTKCRFQMFGSSSGLETYDALCVMPLNVVNEKIFIFLWFWFIILSVLTAVSWVSHVLVLLVPTLRKRVLSVHCHNVKQRCVHLLIRNGKFGDFFLLYMIGMNTDTVIFNDLIMELFVKINKLSV